MRGMSLSVRNCNRDKTVNLHEAGGFRLRLFQSFIRTVIVISPASNPNMINIIVLCEYTSILVFDAREGICDLIAVL